MIKVSWDFPFLEEFVAGLRILLGFPFRRMAADSFWSLLVSFHLSVFVLSVSLIRKFLPNKQIWHEKTYNCFWAMRNSPFNLSPKMVLN